MASTLVVLVVLQIVVTHGFSFEDNIYLVRVLEDKVSWEKAQRVCSEGMTLARSLSADIFKTNKDEKEEFWVKKDEGKGTSNCSFVSLVKKKLIVTYTDDCKDKRRPVCASDTLTDMSSLIYIGVGCHTVASVILLSVCAVKLSLKHQQKAMTKLENNKDDAKPGDKNSTASPEYTLCIKESSIAAHGTMLNTDHMNKEETETATVNMKSSFKGDQTSSALLNIKLSFQDEKTASATVNIETESINVEPASQNVATTSIDEETATATGNMKPASKNEETASATVNTQSSSQIEENATDSLKIGSEYRGEQIGIVIMNMEPDFADEVMGGEAKWEDQSSDRDVFPAPPEPYFLSDSISCTQSLANASEPFVSTIDEFPLDEEKSEYTVAPGAALGL